MNDGVNGFDFDANGEPRRTVVELSECMHGFEREVELGTLGE